MTVPTILMKIDSTAAETEGSRPSPRRCCLAVKDVRRARQVVRQQDGAAGLPACRRLRRSFKRADSRDELD
jgi:hypothetical protein